MSNSALGRYSLEVTRNALSGLQSLSVLGVLPGPVNTVVALGQSVITIIDVSHNKEREFHQLTYCFRRISSRTVRRVSFSRSLSPAL